VGLYQAVLSHLCSNLLGAWEDELQINSEICVPWVGKVVLAAATVNADSVNPIPLPDFIRDWRDALPEDWRNSAQLDIIKDHYDLVTPTTIAAKGRGPKAEEGASGQTTDKKRKWHEMFKAGRK
jgi:hypothetical protein